MFPLPIRSCPFICSDPSTFLYARLVAHTVAVSCHAPAIGSKGMLLLPRPPLHRLLPHDQEGVDLQVVTASHKGCLAACRGGYSQIQAVLSSALKRGRPHTGPWQPHWQPCTLCSQPLLGSAAMAGTAATANARCVDVWHMLMNRQLQASLQLGMSFAKCS